VATCLYCGLEFLSHNPRRLYCSERCRRDFQDDRRRAERAEQRETRERIAWDEKPHWLQDPWALCDEDDDAWDGRWCNALLDPVPVEDDAPWGVVEKTPKRKRKKHDGWLWLPGVPQCCGVA